MNVLFVVPDLHGYGGIQLACRLALRALHEEFGADQVAVISQNDTTAALEKSVQGWVYGGGGSKRRTATAVMKTAYSRRWDAGIFMHVNLSPLIPLWVSRPPTLVILYGIDVCRPLARSVRWGVRAADRIVSISEHTRREAIAYNPWMSELQHRVCLLGVPPTNGVPEILDSSAPEDAPYALAVGRMVGKDRAKGFDELINVWPRVSVARPGLRLIMIGDGPDRPRLENLARTNGADGKFLGRVDDHTRDYYLQHCAAFCLPSRGEGFGLVYVEAMRVGRPVLTGSGDAGAEVIRDRVTGRAVDPTNPDELVEGLLDVTGPNAAAYGEAGRRRFEELFTYERFRERFHGIVRELADR